MRTGTTLAACAGALILMSCGGGGGDSTSPGPTATSVAISAGDSQVAPVSTVLNDSLSVLVLDNNAHPIAGVTVTWAATGGGSVSPATSLTGATGIARTARTLGATAGVAGATATVSGLPAVHFISVGQVQGAVTIASHVSTALTDTVLGTLVDPEPRPSVIVKDQNGIPVAGVTVLWTSGGGGSVTTASVPTDGNGVSTVGYTFGATAGAGYQAHATVAGLQGSPVDLALTATAGAPVAVAKSSGDGQLLNRGTSTPLVVLVTDSHGNPVSGVTIDWAATGGGSVTPSSNSTGANGKATATRTLGAASGIDSTTASAPGIAGSPSVLFTTQAAPVTLVGNNFFSPTSQTITAGDSVLFDWNGVTVAHNVTFAVVAGAPTNIGNNTSGSFWRVFATPGTYNFQCTNHPGMTGSVTVN